MSNNLDDDRIRSSKFWKPISRNTRTFPRRRFSSSIMLSLGHWFSDAALDASAGALVKSYRLFSYDLVPMSEFKETSIGACRSTSFY